MDSQYKPLGYHNFKDIPERVVVMKTPHKTKWLPLSHNREGYPNDSNHVSFLKTQIRFKE